MVHVPIANTPGHGTIFFISYYILLVANNLFSNHGGVFKFSKHTPPYSNYTLKQNLF